MAWASIHTAKPSSQGDNEITYKGYARVPVELEIGALYIRVMFPEVTEDTDLVMTHVAIGSEAEGDGEIFLSLACEPHVPIRVMQPGKVPNVIIHYPDTLAKSARIAHQMVTLGKLRTSEMEPKFFEEVNDHLNAHHIPILTVVRSASAHLIGSLANRPGFNNMNGNATN